MCLEVGTVDLGDLAHVALDADGYRLWFTPGLSSAQRRYLAREVLAAAGQEQPDCGRGTVVCQCGFLLDVSTERAQNTG